MDVVLYGWPWLALIAGAILVLVLGLAPRPAGAPPRLRDPKWLLQIGLPIYMLHQFEEHGRDVFGRPYPFHASFCGVLGHPDLATCPADPAFLFAVNVGAVWIAFITGALAGPRHAMVGATALGIPLVNAFMHIGPAVAKQAYNPGVLTSVLLLLPLALIGLRGLAGAGLLDRPRIAAVVAAGVALHAGLLVSLTAFERGLLSHSALLAVQVALGFVPLALGLVVGNARRA
ncbi:HXXEE domain-containing protein [Nannocystis sp. SCPEA4]|uniref:HXXEE domain-containing protein n=1 Tax=Nannocystis sp. SCPEA4 TaxID=2996787 RepID=UPI00226FB379|nr:HXXEE domain-containing protein [Nannocystis sp. SCPEA4]MCY1056164.1 HXXEE domain-containing protein [Nannocystis sp. SCPEA4]